MVLVRLPSGMRFEPTDRELVVEYLIKKQKGEPLPTNFVKECFHIYGKKNPYPWEVLDKNSDEDYYFFTKLTKRSENRIDRTVGSSGSWKVQHTRTGKSAGDNVEWHKKDFVFETTGHNSARRRRRDHTNGHWLMQEFSLLDHRDDDFVLCRIRNNAKGPHKKKRRAIPINMFDGYGEVEIVVEATAEEIQCNHELLAASSSDLTADEEEGEVQIQRQPKKMRAISSSKVEGLERSSMNVDEAGWNISPSSNQLGALDLQEPAMPPLLLSEESPSSNQLGAFDGQEPVVTPLLMSEESPSSNQLGALDLQEPAMPPLLLSEESPSSNQLGAFDGQEPAMPPLSEESQQILSITSSFNSLHLMFPDTTNSFFPSVSSLPFNPYLLNADEFPSYI